jgi:polyphosphate glucokinase
MAKAGKKNGTAAGTLCIDIGGTGLKVMVVAGDGTALTERLRVDTPQPATPKAVLAEIAKLVAQLPAPYERVSVGFPGVVVARTIKTAPNLDTSWAGFKLGDAVEKLTGKPTRVLNDAGVQGHGVIEGKGVELCITLGTGFGFALYVNGHYVPNLEMAHHPFRRGRTYEEYVGNAALDDVGKKKWNKRVARVIAKLEPIINYDVLYVGGGNARKLEIDLPKNVKIVENVAGLLGGVKLWEHE